MAFTDFIAWIDGQLPGRRRMNQLLENIRYHKGRDGHVLVEAGLDASGPLQPGSLTNAELAAVRNPEGGMIAFSTDNSELQLYRDGFSALGGAVPTGTVKEWAGPTASIPAGWLECDGSSVSQATYAALFSIIGSRFGSPSELYMSDAGSQIYRFDVTELNPSTTLDLNNEEHRYPILAGAVEVRALAGFESNLYTTFQDVGADRELRRLDLDADPPTLTVVGTSTSVPSFTSMGSVAGNMYGLRGTFNISDRQLYRIDVADFDQSEHIAQMSQASTSLGGTEDTLYGIGSDRNLIAYDLTPGEETDSYIGDLPQPFLSLIDYKGLSGHGDSLYAVAETGVAGFAYVYLVNVDDPPNSRRLGTIQHSAANGIVGLANRKVPITEFLLPSIDTGNANTVAVIKA